MLPPGHLTGAVLAGGESRRMGRDKALLTVNGTPLWQRQVAMLRRAGCSVVGVVRRPGQPALELPADVPLWLDNVSGAGPLAGLEAALAMCPTAWLAVAATDMPRLEASWFQSLAAQCHGARGIVSQRADGIFEPLAAIYPKSALAEVQRRLQSANHSLQRLVGALVAADQLSVLSLTAPYPAQLANWNTASDAGFSADDPASAGAI